jgi:hypothetical protein
MLPKKNLPFSFVYVLFVLDIIWQFYLQIHNGIWKESWGVTEWLINYQGGFVRRGLAGEIILWLYNHFGISPYYLILLISASAYILIVAYFIWAFNRKGYSLFLLPFVFFLGNPIINAYWIRKDLVLILFFISILYLLVKKGSLSILWINLLLIIALLMHEAIGFFCFPILFLVLAGKTESIKAIFKSLGSSILKLSPSLITFLLVLYNKGSVISSATIWDSWKTVPFPYQNKNPISTPGSIDGISWSMHRNLNLLKGTLTDFYSGVYAPLLWALIIILVYYILTNANKLQKDFLKKKPYADFNQANLSNILIFQFLTVIPLFVFGCDFGRWIFFWVSSSFVVYFVVPQERLSVLFPSYLTTFGLKFNTLLSRILPKSNWFYYILPFLIGFPYFTSGPTWKVGIDLFYNSTPIVIVFKLVFALVKKCLHLL